MEVPSLLRLHNKRPVEARCGRGRARTSVVTQDHLGGWGGLPLGLCLGHLEALTPAIKGSPPDTLCPTPHEGSGGRASGVILSDEQWKTGRAQPTEAAAATLYAFVY